ncbi:MAG: hypothetical protein ACXWXL_03245, partial [Candidatus Binatia bacterium]
VKDQAGIMFQACGEYKNYTPWTWCWYKRSPQDPNNSQSGTFVDSPDEGFKNGTTNYNARYYEIYNTDLNEATYATKFQQWHDTLAPYIQ